MYAVMGATGRTGRVVAEELLASGKKVRVVSRDANKLSDLVSRGAEAFAGSVDDADAVAKALRGVTWVYTMVPPPTTHVSYEEAGRALADAAVKAGATHVVNLSAIGAHMREGGGHLSDFYPLEQAFNRNVGLNVLHLRAGFFMENLFETIPEIKAKGTMSHLLRPDIAVPWIAARDIGHFAAQALLQLNFEGKSTRELLGHRDISMPETAALIGKAIGNPSLQYKQISSDDSPLPRPMVEMFEVFNHGSIRWLEKRSPMNTTPTSLETFLKDEFVPRFKLHRMAESNS